MCISLKVNDENTRQQLSMGNDNDIRSDLRIEELKELRNPKLVKSNKKQILIEISTALLFQIKALLDELQRLRAQEQTHLVQIQRLEEHLEVKRQHIIRLEARLDKQQINEALAEATALSAAASTNNNNNSQSSDNNKKLNTAAERPMDASSNADLPESTKAPVPAEDDEEDEDQAMLVDSEEAEDKPEDSHHDDDEDEDEDREAVNATTTDSNELKIKKEQQ